MKHVKIYEDYNISDIKVGDYVIIEIEELKKLDDFFNGNIGKITKKHRNFAGIMIYTVEFTNVSFFVHQYFDGYDSIDVKTENIIDVGTVEELTQRYDLRQSAKKFNI